MNADERKNAEYNELNEVEKSYLGCLLSNGEKTATRLTPGDFFFSDHQKIFKKIYELWDAGTTPDIITVSHSLKAEIPASTIAVLTDNPVTFGNISYLENTIFEASKKRLFIDKLAEAKKRIDQHIEPDTIIKDLIPALAAVINARNEQNINSAAALLKMGFPEIKWVIPGLIGEGLTIVYGSPKVGKSWLALSLAIAAACGGRFLGELQASKTEPLYLALEDTDRRINNRLKKLNAQGAGLENLKITSRWRDGYIGLDNYLNENCSIGLVIIDTLAQFANIEDINAYAETTATMARLKRMADERKTAIVVIHHAKKGRADGKDWLENALGSTGLTGAADSMIYIDRPNREKPEAVLYTTGRDTEDQKPRSLTFDLTLKGWVITPNANKNAASGDKKNGKGKQRTE